MFFKKKKYYQIKYFENSPRLRLTCTYTIRAKNEEKAIDKILSYHTTPITIIEVKEVLF